MAAEADESLIDILPDMPLETVIWVKAAAGFWPPVWLERFAVTEKEGQLRRVRLLEFQSLLVEWKPVKADRLFGSEFLFVKLQSEHLVRQAFEEV
jgi:hypothetical protein